MAKRTLDVVAAAFGLVLTAPVILVCALLVKLDSPGPILYRGLRMGRGESRFHILKLRSMVAADQPGGSAITRAGDARVTRVGRVLRRTKLDELPQLVNVLRGEMSLVGPRPEHPSFLPYYTLDQREVLSVRPGITSPASIAYRSEEELLSGENPEIVYVQRILPAKLELDLAYVRRPSLRADLAILAATAARVLRFRAT